MEAAILGTTASDTAAIGEREVRHGIRRRLLKGHRALIIHTALIVHIASEQLPTFLDDFAALAAHPAIHAQLILASDIPSSQEAPDPIFVLLEHAVNQKGSDAVCILSGETPHLPPAFLAEAFARLADPTTDLVLGPGDDDGIYLLGMRRPVYGVLGETAPFQPDTLSDILARAQAFGLAVALLPRWYTLGHPHSTQRLQCDLSLGTVVAPGTEASLSL